MVRFLHQMVRSWSPSTSERVRTLDLCVWIYFIEASVDFELILVYFRMISVYF